VSSVHVLPRGPARPDRPGPGPIPGQLLRALDISIARRVEGLLAGDYRSALLGQGTELAQVRPYVPGDDVRQIEWNVTARTGEPHVRVQLAERVLVTWLVLDTSPSMQFGTADRRKADVAEGVAIAIGHIASRRGNRLGVVTFGDAQPRAVPPRQGRVGLIGLLETLRSESSVGYVGRTLLGATSLGLRASAGGRASSSGARRLRATSHRAMSGRRSRRTTRSGAFRAARSGRPAPAAAARPWAPRHRM